MPRWRLPLLLGHHLAYFCLTLLSGIFHTFTFGSFLQEGFLYWPHSAEPSVAIWRPVLSVLAVSAQRRPNLVYVLKSLSGLPWAKLFYTEVETSKLLLINNRKTFSSFILNFSTVITTNSYMLQTQPLPRQYNLNKEKRLLTQQLNSWTVRWILQTV